MTREEIAFAIAALLVLAAFAIASSVFVAIVITELIEERRARRTQGGKQNEPA
jgi:hypothetical protein